MGWSEEVDLLVVACAAGANALRKWLSNSSYHGELMRKNDGSASVQGEKDSQAAIKKEIRLWWGEDCSFIREEEDGEASSKDSENVFVVDPLDGTTNFVLHARIEEVSPNCSISIAKANNDGVVVAGVVFELRTSNLYIAERGVGAWKIENGWPRKLSLKSEISMRDAVLALECNWTDSDSQLKYQRWKQAIEPPLSMRLRMEECAALQMCRVAEGAGLDGYLHPTDAPWDMCAGGLIVQEAGGIVFSPGRDDWKPLEYRGVVCLAPSLADDVKRFLGE